MEVVIFVDVSEQTLAHWLEGHTAHVARRAFPTPKGELRLYALRGMTLASAIFGPSTWMRGVLSMTRPRKREREILTAVCVSLIPLGPRRTELRLSTDWPALEGYLAEIVTAIRQRWNVSSPDAAVPTAAPPPSARRKCAHSGDDMCPTCSEFLAKIAPLLTIGARKPKQEDVADALGYTTRHIRRLCEGLGYHAWSDFYAAVRSGKLSSTS